MVFGCGDLLTDIWYSEAGEDLFMPDASLCISFMVLMIDESLFSTSSMPSKELVFGFLLGGSGSVGTGDWDFLSLILSLMPPVGVSSILLQV